MFVPCRIQHFSHVPVCPNFSRDTGKSVQIKLVSAKRSMTGFYPQHLAESSQTSEPPIQICLLILFSFCKYKSKSSIMVVIGRRFPQAHKHGILNVKSRNCTSLFAKKFSTLDNLSTIFQNPQPCSNQNDRE